MSASARPSSGGVDVLTPGAPVLIDAAPGSCRVDGCRMHHGYVRGDRAVVVQQAAGWVTVLVDRTAVEVDLPRSRVITTRVPA